MKLPVQKYSVSAFRGHSRPKSCHPGMIWDSQNLLLETNASNVILARYTDFLGKTGLLLLRLASSLAALGGPAKLEPE